MSALLEVSNLTTGFLQKDKRTLTAVDGVSFSLQKGEILGVVGESGCGKSVTSLSIMRLLGENGRIQNGEISFKGQDLAKVSGAQMRKIRGDQIAMVFQDPMTTLNPVHTIGRHIAEPLRIHRGLDKRQARKRAIELLEQVGIPRPQEIVDEYPHRLSGGMRQRVMIAIAIACHPQLIIADEPTTALDVTIQAQILDLLRKIKDEHETAILLITHDLGVVAEMCDRVVVMYAGQVVEEGTVEEIFNHPTHPYTVGLLESLPQMEGRRERLYSIPGTVPTLDAMPTGCRFVTRCEHAMAKCHQTPPALEQVTPEHRSRCWLVNASGEGESS